MSRKELILEYQKADILFLHLNDCKAFETVLPSKLFEYAMFGKPMLAGVSGYAAEFIQRHIPWCAVFHPCDIEGAIQQLALLEQNKKTISAELIDQFYQKFNRAVLMGNLANKVVSTISL